MKANELIIYSDMDGTLRSFDDEWDEINSRNKSAIINFTSSGGYFSIATGRSINDISPDILSLCNMPLVLLQGSYVYDHLNNKEVATNSVYKDVKKVLLDYAKSDENVIMIFSSCDKKYTIKLDGNRPNPLGSTYSDCDEDFFMSADAITIEFDTDSKHAKEVEKKLENMKLKGMKVLMSADVCVETFKVDCSKSYGIEKSIEYVSSYDKEIKKRTLACIGDYYNDVEMLKSAQISATLEDAIDDIKKLCSIITCKSKDGAVADFIERLLKI